MSTGDGTTISEFSTIAMDSKGDFVVSWESSNAVSNSVLARRYNLAGTPTSNLITVTTGSSQTAHYPSVGINSVGAFVVAWELDQQQGGSINAQQYDLQGHAKGNAITVAQGNAGTYETLTSIAMNAVGDFVVTWWNNSGNVYAHAYKSSGQSEGSQITVSAGYLASVAMNGADNFVIVWVNINQSAKFNILAQRYRN